jgi:hypothetical protein
MLVDARRRLFVYHPVIPAVFVTYCGLGMSFIPLSLSAVQGVAGDQAGVAWAILNTAQQIGAAFAVAVLATISTSIANRHLPEASRVLQEGLMRSDDALVSRASEALSYGYSIAFRIGAASLVVAAAGVRAAINTRRTQRMPH